MLNKNEPSQKVPKPGLSEIPKSKRSQVGDTLTWLIATLIIIFILGIFIYIANGLAKANQISGTFKELFSSNSDNDKVNWLNVKTNLAFDKNSDNKAEIEGWIKNG